MAKTFPVNPKYVDHAVNKLLLDNDLSRMDFILFSMLSFGVLIRYMIARGLSQEDFNEFLDQYDEPTKNAFYTCFDIGASLDGELYEEAKRNGHVA